MEPSIITKTYVYPKPPKSDEAKRFDRWLMQDGLQYVTGPDVSEDESKARIAAARAAWMAAKGGAA